MVTIAVAQILGDSTMYEHRCVKNIKKLYKSSGKYYDQQQYNIIIAVEMFYTPEIFNENIPMSPIQSVTVKKPSARKSF